MIIPHYALNKFLNFLKSGNNPAHCWKAKGNWKAQFYMDEKKLSEEEVVKALEDFIDRFVIDTEEGSIKISDILSQIPERKTISKNIFVVAVNEAQRITNLDWFKECYLKSTKLQKFYNDYKNIKSI